MHNKFKIIVIDRKKVSILSLKIFFWDSFIYHWTINVLKMFILDRKTLSKIIIFFSIFNNT